MATTIKSIVILRTGSDWKPWIELIKTSALEYDIWKFVDPNIEVEDIPKFVEPEAPTPNDVKAAIDGRSKIRYAELSADEKEEYISLKEEFKINQKRWNDQKLALGKLRTKIQESIDVANLTFTYDCDSAYQMLRNLANHFAPTDDIRKQEMLLEWKNLQNDLPKNQDLNEWIQKWMVAYNDMGRLRLPDVEGTRPVYDFLNAISNIDPVFTSNWNMRLAMNEKISLPDLLTTFKNYRRSTANQRKLQPQHGMFNAKLHGMKPEIHSSLEEQNDTSKLKKKWPKCPCGFYHNSRRPITSCWYLIPAARPKDWKGNSDKVKKIAERLASDTSFKLQVEEWKKLYKPKTKPSSSENELSEHRPSTPPVTVMGALGRMSAFTSNLSGKSMTEQKSMFRISEADEKPMYELHNSTILDSGATIHVFNDKSRFIKFSDELKDDNHLWAGENIIPISGWGTVKINLTSPKYLEGRDVTLINVAYVPTLHTSIVSLRLLIKVGVHWNTEKGILTYNGNHFADTPMMYDQWVLEYKPLDTSGNQAYVTTFSNEKASLSENSKNSEKRFHDNSSRVMRIQKGTFDDWHIRMGHLYAEALLHLPKVTKGCEMTTKKPLNPVCEICRMSNSKRIISRVPRNRATRPFWRVSWDIIFMKENQQNEAYIIHFICDYTRMNFVYTLPSKQQETVLNTFMTFSAYVKRNWGCEIVVWKGDGESSLGAKWDAWINGHGYEVETSAPHTQEQNGAAERSGGMLLATGTELRSIYGIPDTMWKEILSTAGYLLNRSPNRSLNFKTPYGFLMEIMTGIPSEPLISHLQPYGCKAYSYIKNRPKLEKLAPKAEIGFLVGYDSTNIYRIWIPSRNVVISTRDVTFDPSQGYNTRTKKVEVTDEIIEILKVPQVEVDNKTELQNSIYQNEDYNFEDNEASDEETGNQEYTENEINNKDMNMVKFSGGLPTPESTPGPESSISVEYSLK